MAKFSAYFVLLTAMITPFQNCTPALGGSEKTQISKGVQLGGNGEGYTGKLNGTYASIDTQNMCGQNSGEIYKVVNEIKVQSNQLVYTVKDCQVLPTPQPIPQPVISKVESAGTMFALGNQMFQKGGFIPLRQADSEEFADFFCGGFEATEPAPGVRRLTELTVYQETETIFNIPILFNQSWRKGYLRIIDINKATDKVISNTVYNFDPMMQTLVNEIDSSTRVYSIYNVDGPHDFAMTYVHSGDMVPFYPTSLDYAINGGEIRSATAAYCYQTY